MASWQGTHRSFREEMAAFAKKAELHLITCGRCGLPAVVRAGHVCDRCKERVAA